MTKGKSVLFVFWIVLILVSVLIVSGVTYSDPTTVYFTTTSPQCTFLSEPTNQQGGANVECPDGSVVAGGGFSGVLGEANMEKSFPLNNGWYCNYDKEDNASCWAVCCDANMIETTIVETQGELKEGLFAECPSGYEIVGGGFYDARNHIGEALGSDQDDSKPLENGWYCRDDDSGDGHSKCYAICAKSKLNTEELSCTTASETQTIDGGWGEAHAECPGNYFLTGGGFSDLSLSKGDPDFSYPVDNGWFYRENFQDKPAVAGIAYAQCCSFVSSCIPEEEICDGLDNDCDGEIDENNICDIECNEDSECGIDGWLADEFCERTSDVWDSWISYECVNPGAYNSYCDSSIELKLKEDRGEDYCGSWQNYCNGNDVYRERTCYEQGCENNDYYSDSSTEDEFVEECSYQCSNGECIDRCQENEDCGLPTEELVCLDGNVYNKITTPTCTQGNCENVITYELVEECAKECDNGMCIECCEDEECGTDGFIGEKYCQGKSVYQDYQEFSCVNNQCESYVTPMLIEECSYMCVNGVCVEEEYCTDEDCPEDSYGENYCKNNNVYREFYNYFCENHMCNVNITEEIFENCGEDYCGSWQNYCNGNDVYKKRTCYGGGCRNGECYSNSSIEDEFVEECDYDCKNGKCVEEEKEYKGGGKKLEVDYCGDGVCDRTIEENELNCPEDCKILISRASGTDSGTGTVEEIEDKGTIGLGKIKEILGKEGNNRNFLIPAILIIIIAIIVIIIILVA